VLTDRDLAVEYARRHGLQRRQRRETAARFRERVVHELYAAGRWGPAEQVLLNEERTGDVALKGTLVPALLTAERGDTLIRQYAEETQTAFDQLRPRRGVLGLGRSWPRAVNVTVDLGAGRVALSDLTELVIEDIQAAVEQARLPRRVLWPAGSRPLSVHVHFHPWRAVDLELSGRAVSPWDLAAPIAERMRTRWPAGSQPRIAWLYLHLGPAVVVENIHAPTLRRSLGSRG
jgi:hypothetical protein